MAAALKKNIGKIGQWTGEKLGRDGGKNRNLQSETDTRHQGMDGIQQAYILYTTQLLKKKDATDASRQKLYLLENLGASMVRLGGSLPRDSNYGRALERLGQVEERMNDSQLQFVAQIKEGWGSSLQRALDDFKEYQQLQRKMESRRADYDGRMAKYNKARKESVQLEDELRSAQTRYEDTYDDLAQRMMTLQDAEQGYLNDLYGFYEAQMAHYQQCYEMLDGLRGSLDELMASRRAPAADRNPMGGSLTTRHSTTSLRASDRNLSMPTRRPIPFNSPHGRSLSRSATTSAARGYSGSQYSDNSDEMQAQYNYAHGIDSTPDGGGLEGSLAVPRPNPQLARVQSEIGTNGSRRAPPPPVAPRRHAPAPPMPTRTPRRILRKTIYAFNPDEGGELALAVGDIVEVSERVDDGWWMGSIVHSQVASRLSQSGLFPANYTEDCQEADVPPRLPSKASSPGLRTQADPFMSYNPPPAHRARTQPDHPHQPAGHQRTNSQALAAAKPCACGCDDYSPNLFKKGNCTNCFHNH
ncbi:BAR-domain-containing protein [Linderina pennispora]|uniref:BAR-domain-containing protein n=1 Tax=Linderina pennispora TaxID=61395 RepID=A0A1Y1WJF8_9FUNG|nr:BAR-domain-containing protein [Linderina pennispora]ORX73234.1 BAR-domain-containing protein [Linderina pennispora]